MQELVYTETKFVEQLNSVKELYAKPMRSSKMFNDCKYLVELFEDVDTLLETHTVFLQCLKTEHEKSGSGASFAPFFTHVTSKVDKYKHYSLIWQKAMDQLDSITKQSKKHMEFLNTVSTTKHFKCSLRFLSFSNTQKYKKCGSDRLQGKIGFQNLSIQPIQRTMRYVMLLKTIFKNTPEEHTDYYPLKMVIAKMANFSLEIENFQKFERVKEISNLFRQGDTFLLSEEVDEQCKREHCWQQVYLNAPESCCVCFSAIKSMNAFKCSECALYAHEDDASKCRPSCVGVRKPGKLENGRRFFLRDGNAIHREIRQDLHSPRASETAENVSLFLFNDSLAVAHELSNRELKMLDFVRWQSEATKTWATCVPTEGDETSLLISSSISLSRKHCLTFPKQSVRDSWMNEILESIDKWKESAKFRYAKNTKFFFQADKLLQVGFDLKAVAEVGVTFDDESKKRKIETV